VAIAKGSILVLEAGDPFSGGGMVGVGAFLVRVDGVCYGSIDEYSWGFLLG